MNNIINEDFSYNYPAIATIIINNSDLQNINIAYQLVMGKGYLSYIEYLQFLNAGVNLLKIISAIKSDSVEIIYQQIKENKIAAFQVRDALTHFNNYLRQETSSNDR